MITMCERNHLHDSGRQAAACDQLTGPALRYATGRAPAPGWSASEEDRGTPWWCAFVVLAMFLIFAVSVGVAIAQWEAPPAPAVAPTTYGPPGPAGGFTSMPVGVELW